jgi:hypothetical protein
MFERLKHRWALKHTAQVLMVLLVFALTGTTILVLKQPLLTLIFGDDPQPVWFSVMYYILILPVYNLLLLMYGAILGQFVFFWQFEKRFFNRIFRRKVAA